MNVRLLIDGYNLLFTSGMDGRGRGAGWLQRARERLIKFLQAKLPASELATTTVVFDAARQPFRNASDGVSISDQAQASSGPQIIFAIDHDEADDLLESMIRKHSAPKSLTVVSSDHRIRKCAIARRATSLDVEAFLAKLEASATHDETELPSDNEDQLLSPDEVQRWLREFGEST
jgi:hypothetical protein